MNLRYAIAAAITLAACSEQAQPPRAAVNDGAGPTAGVVRDGAAAGGDLRTQFETDRLSAHWFGFVDPDGVEDYEWAIGRSPGGQQVQPWRSTGRAAAATATHLALEVGVHYYVAVRAVDSLGNVGTMAVSNGLRVEEPMAQGASGASTSAGGPAPTAPGGGAPPHQGTNAATTWGTTGGNGGAASVSSITRHGITWTFDRPYPAGRFANGDWWVEGPVDILSIYPPSAQIQGRVMHGAMANPDASVRDQAYDSEMYAGNAPSFFAPQRNAALGVGVGSPLRVDAGTSLVSTESRGASGALPQLRSAAVLTVLDEPAPADAFRPPYAGRDKRIRWRVGQLDTSRLLRLAPQGAVPAWSEVEGWFERVWLDHSHGWLGRFMHPEQNMPDYGRDMSHQIGVAALMLHLDVPPSQKRDLLVRIVQLGIDFYGIAEAGGRWPSDGGHSSGRKFPILFAGALLGDPAFAAATQQPTVRFGEDGQTFYVEETSPGVYNWGHGGYTAADVDMPEWGFQHDTNPSRDHRSWTADNYRVCCTANCWVGWVLASRMMGLQSGWGHDALFDYQDRYMGIEPAGTWTRSWSRFAEAMWDVYRPHF